MKEGERQKFEPKPKGTKKRNCHNCRKLGYWAKKCRQPKREVHVLEREDVEEMPLILEGEENLEDGGSGSGDIARAV